MVKNNLCIRDDLILGQIAHGAIADTKKLYKMKTVPKRGYILNFLLLSFEFWWSFQSLVMYRKRQLLKLYFVLFYQRKILYLIHCQKIWNKNKIHTRNNTSVHRMIWWEDRILHVIVIICLILLYYYTLLAQRITPLATVYEGH